MLLFLIAAISLSLAGRVEWPNRKAEFQVFNSSWNTVAPQLFARTIALAKQLGELQRAHPQFDSSCAQFALAEAKDFLEMSALGSVIERRLAFVTSLLKQNRSQWPSGKQQDPRTGGWATLCVESYWLQLEYTFNEVQALSEKGQSPRYSLALFLERFSQPSSMLAYLKSLRRSRLSVTGTDNTLAQNIVLSNLVRLVLRRWPLNYSWNAESGQHWSSIFKTHWIRPRAPGDSFMSCKTTLLCLCPIYPPTFTWSNIFLLPT